MIKIPGPEPGLPAGVAVVQGLHEVLRRKEIPNNPGKKVGVKF